MPSSTRSAPNERARRSAAALGGSCGPGHMAVIEADDHWGIVAAPEEVRAKRDRSLIVAQS